MNTCKNLSDFDSTCPSGCGRVSGDCPFRKIVIPAEMGTDEEGQENAPENGAYQNAIVYYEANGVSYIYSSDGIPTKIAQITGIGEVISINGKKGVVTLTLAELGGKTGAEIDAMITSKGYQTGTQVDAKVAAAKAQVEAEIPTDNAQLTNGAGYQTASQVNTAITSKGYQTAQQVDSAITSKGYQTAAQVNTAITSKGYQTASQVNTAITSKGYQTGTQVDGKIATAKTQIEAEIPNVINNTSSTSTTDALSANQGNVLNTRINNIESRGRYLSTWNCTTGQPGTQPTSLPYTYKTGDYYIVSTTGTTNYKPNGASYTGAASTTTESNTVSVNDTYLYDGTSWALIHTDVPSIAIDDELSTTSRNPVENRIVTGALNNKADSSNTYTKTEVDTALTAKQNTLSAGTNISIANDIISATDTTYSPFTGASASAAGAAGLVPAPAIGDESKYLKGDGTWGTVQAGPTVVQSTGTSTTDVMSQNAVTSSLFADPGTNSKIRIGNTAAVGNDSMSIGVGAQCGTARDATLLGYQASTWNSGDKATSIGYQSRASSSTGRDTSIGAMAKSQGGYSVAVGAYSEASTQGEVSFGGSNLSTSGYNGTQYRLLTNVHDPQNDHDAATKGYVDSHGGGPTVVQTTGTSTTDVMSQNAVTGMVYSDTTSLEPIKIGKNATNYSSDSITIGTRSNVAYSNIHYGIAIGMDGALVGANYGMAFGSGQANSQHSIAFGYNTSATGLNSMALGRGSVSTAQGEVSFGNSTRTDLYNGTGYRLLTNIYDPQNDHDAANKQFVVSYAALNGAGAPTTSTAAKYVGQLYYDTTNSAMYYCSAISGSTYTWTALGGGSGPTVVQSTGTSTTDVMSQDATTKMVYDSGSRYKINIGVNNTASAANPYIVIGSGSTAVGGYATAIQGSTSSWYSTAIGGYIPSGANYATHIGGIRDSIYKVQSEYAVGLGSRSKVPANATGSVAIGAYSGENITAAGIVDVSSSDTTTGYNNSNYRLLTGLYDPQNDHDAATKKYVDEHSSSSSVSNHTLYL